MASCGHGRPIFLPRVGGTSAGSLMNCNHFQFAMLAYNLNCRLMLFNREEQAKVETLQHTTLATARRGSYSWRPRSGVTPEEWASATAIITPSRESSTA